MSFYPEWNLEKIPQPEDFIVGFSGNAVFAETDSLRLLTFGSIGDSSFLKSSIGDFYFLGTLDGCGFFLHWKAGADYPKHMLSEIRPFFLGQPAPGMSALSSAKETYHWLEKHKFCGNCGERLQPGHTERVLRCGSCGTCYYPKISPAVITAVLNGKEILLAHNKNFPDGLYSLIAGFVDPGETAEEAVAREILEETGIQIENIRYAGSQHWPFPDSLMLGFLADFKSGEIRPDNDEITDARWFTAENLPVLPGKGSIARRLLESIYPHLKNR